MIRRTNRKLTLEQRITRLERLLQCDNKSCNKHMKFEAREALDIDGGVLPTHIMADYKFLK